MSPQSHDPVPVPPGTTVAGRSPARTGPSSHPVAAAAPSTTPELEVRGHDGHAERVAIALLALERVRVQLERTQRSLDTIVTQVTRDAAARAAPSSAAPSSSVVFSPPAVPPSSDAHVSSSAGAGALLPAPSALPRPIRVAAPSAVPAAVPPVPARAPRTRGSVRAPVDHVAIPPAAIAGHLRGSDTGAVPAPAVRVPSGAPFKRASGTGAARRGPAARPVTTATVDAPVVPPGALGDHVLPAAPLRAADA